MSLSKIVDFHAYGLKEADISKVGEETINAIGKQVIDNFKTNGFCYLKNHGIDENLLDEYFRVSRNFFEQPNDLKGQFPLGDDYMFGYVKLERETLNLERSAGDLHEAFNYVPAFERQWPPVEKFEEVTKAVHTAGKALAFRFFDVLSAGLELPTDFMRKAHGGNVIQTRIYYYPIVKDNVAPDEARMGEHTDWGSFTFHFQNETGGLEVQTPDGEFIAADPIPGTCVVTPSVLLQRWTSDKVKAATHRELIPKDDRRNKVGQAIIVFIQPDMDYEVKCLDGSDKYPPITVKDYFAYRAKDSMKRD